MSERSKLFISYCHEDIRWLKAVREQLAVLEREDLLDVFEDTKLGAGEQWFERLHSEMSQARVGLLLLSAPFLSSSFVRDQEIPKLFARHANGGMLIYPLLVRPCPWQQVAWLAKLQLRPQDSNRRPKAVSAFSGAARDQILADVASEIATLVKPAGNGSSSEFSGSKESTAPESEDHAELEASVETLTPKQSPVGLADLESKVLALQRTSGFPFHVLNRYAERTSKGLTWKGPTSADLFAVSPKLSVTVKRRISCIARLLEPRESGADLTRPRPAISALQCLLLPLGLLRFAVASKCEDVRITLALRGVRNRTLSFEAVDEILRPGPTWQFRFWNHDSSPCLEPEFALDKVLSLSSENNSTERAATALFSELAYFFAFRVHADSLAHPPERIQSLCKELSDWIDRGAAGHESVAGQT